VKANSLKLEFSVAGGICLKFITPYHAMKTSFGLHLQCCVMIMLQLCGPLASDGCDYIYCELTELFEQDEGEKKEGGLAYLERKRPWAHNNPKKAPVEEWVGVGESIAGCDGEVLKPRDCGVKSLLFDRFQERTVCYLESCTLKDIITVLMNLLELTVYNLQQTRRKCRHLQG
jgi:hypothetical protein